MYRIEPIGAQFKGKQHEQLSARFNQLESEGWELVQVFPVVVSGCLGQKDQTNYAVFHRRDSSAAS